ncbi:MAG: Crp/Fnr family transcriptional regulator, partial [Burkholderiales bacterium]
MTDLAIQPAVLSAAPPFSALPERERISLLTRLPRRIYPARAIIVRAGEPSCGLYALLSGSAKLVMDDTEGRQVTLALLRAGDLFGEIDPFEPQAHIATVVATKPCEVVRMPIDELVACMTAHPRAALLVIAELARRLRSRALRSTTFIRGLRRHCSIAPNADGIVWKVDVGSEDVARIVGASREMVSRVLKNLREAGLIGRCGHRIDILNHDGLNKECVRTF